MSARTDVDGHKTPLITPDPAGEGREEGSRGREDDKQKEKQIRGEKLAADDTGRRINDRAEEREEESPERKREGLHSICPLTQRGSRDAGSLFTLAPAAEYYGPDEYLFIYISGFALSREVLFGLAGPRLDHLVFPRSVLKNRTQSRSPARSENTDYFL